MTFHNRPNPGWAGVVNEMRILRFRDSWPLILVAIGLHTMWKAVVRRTPPSASQPGPRS